MPAAADDRSRAGGGGLYDGVSDYWPAYGEMLAFELWRDEGTGREKVVARVNNEEIEIMGVRGGKDLDTFKRIVQAVVAGDERGSYTKP